LATVAGPGGPAVSRVLNLKVSGSKVTGTFTHLKGKELQLQNGKLEGKQLSFDATAELNGRTYHSHFTGEASADAITLHGGVDGKQVGPALTFHRSPK
jgi:hypothetical protein